MQLLNYLLSALEPEDLSVLMPALGEATLAPGQVLFEIGDRVDTLFFPSSACISVVSVMSDGRTVETTTTGRETAVALIDAVTDQPSRSRAFAQIPGAAMRMPAGRFRARMAEPGAAAPGAAACPRRRRPG